MAVGRRLRLAVFKLASCNGCQLSLLDCENELLSLMGEVELANFLEASREVARGPYDVSLVEGSVTTAQDAERIREVRRSSRTLISLGACATAGGIQALRNFRNLKELVATVYPTPEYISTLETASPIAAHVKVDLELRGCPISKRQLLEVLSALLRGRRPHLPTHSVCLECKRRGAVCVMVAQGTPCLGPVTQAGCDALCPSLLRGCFGCGGPAETPNLASLGRQWEALGADSTALVRAFCSFNAASAAFRDASQPHEHQDA